jgi:hypothetical protein
LAFWIAVTVVPQRCAMPLNVSPHWTVIELGQPDQAEAPPVEPNEATRIARTTIVWKILFVIAFSLYFLAGMWINTIGNRTWQPVFIEYSKKSSCQ